MILAILFKVIGISKQKNFENLKVQPRMCTRAIGLLKKNFTADKSQT